MAWLGTWAHRRKVTVSNTNIDSNLTHFPLLLTLGTSVGTGNTDVSSIFDELTSDGNRKKIAFTKTDGTTQLYAEIEKWVDANEYAVIWISKSDLVLASGATTDIYMYYDSTEGDNNTYIGDTNSVVAESVWDSNYKMVQHLADGASTSATYDSTSNDNDGTKRGAAEPAVITSGKIGNAQDFDGINDYLKTPESFMDGVIAAASVSFWFKPSITINSGNKVAELFMHSVGGSGRYLTIGFHNGGSGDEHIEVTLRTGEGSETRDCISTTATWTAGIYYHITAAWDASGTYIYVNGVSEDSGTYTSGWGGDTGSNTPHIGSTYNGGAEWFDGIIDEFRFSLTHRAAAWIKANYYCQTDALVAWSSEESSVSAPTVTTQAVTNIAEETATGNGNITDDGGDAGATRGMCWDTSPTPTIADDIATNGTGEGAYTVAMTGLVAGTHYYVRAYSINSAGTSYGSQVEFDTAISHTKILTETLSISESITRSDFSKTLTEFMLVSELSASQTEFKFASIDSLAFTESLVNTFGLKRTEALAFVESLSESVERTASLSDIFTLTESQKVQVSKKFIETMTISEGHAYEMPTVIRYILHIGP